MRQRSWACTLITQLSLCIAVYVALNVGHPHGRFFDGGRSSEIYFITVAGGFRPLEEQSLLLQQMAKVAKSYKARFVVDISKLSGFDPLRKNATMVPKLQHIPWYITGASGGPEETYYLKKFKFPYGQTLDIISLDTMQFQDMSSVRGTGQLMWLMRTLNESNSDWRIVVGYHKLISCSNNTLKMKEGAGAGTPFKLRDILLSHEVDAFISMDICAGHLEPGSVRLSVTRARDEVSSRGKEDGFLLHGISSLNMAMFVVKSTGEVQEKLYFPQRGRAAM